MSYGRARRNSDRLIDVQEIGRINSPWGVFPIMFSKVPASVIEGVQTYGPTICTTINIKDIDKEQLNVVRLNDLPAVANVPQNNVSDVPRQGPLVLKPKGFYHDYPFDFTPEARQRVFSNPRARRNTMETVETLNPSEPIPYLEIVGKSGEFNLSKVLFSLMPLSSGEYHIVLKKWTGQDCALDRADLTFGPDELGEAQSFYSQYAPELPEGRYKLVDSTLNPTAYLNPRRGQRRAARPARKPRY